MSQDKRQTWGNRFTFILAAIGSAVGLGNAWRFPGLAAKYGGGAFLLAYLIGMFLLGIPLLMMEIAIGRKYKKGAPGALASLNKKFEPIGWAATTNAFIIAVYYAVVFAWVIMMAILSFKFLNIVGNTEAASNIWAEAVKTTWDFKGFDVIAWLVVGCLVIAWGSIYFCIRNGVSSVSKVVKYTVFAPVVCLVIMAIKGFTMPGALEGIKVLFVPDFTAWANPELWVAAFGQVFYSLSIMMAIMFAYGSFLKEDSNIAKDTCIIAFSDFLTSLLSAVVLFTTMYGTGSSIDDMSDSGIATAFLIYPQAIATISSSGVFNMIFAFVFYFCLVTLAIDSAFSLIEGISTAISDKFKTNRKKTTLVLCIISACLSLTMVSGAGVAILDTVDYFCNYINLVFIGILEAVAVGWFYKTSNVLDEINKNTKKFKMPSWWFITSVKVISPILLVAFFVWNVVELFVKKGGIYGGYSLTSNIICGWLMVAFVFASGFIVKLLEKKFVKEEE